MLKSFLTYVLLSGSSLNVALDACESPSTLRAAFTVELESEGVSQICEYDPRPNSLQAFECSIPKEESEVLNEKIDMWKASAHPDNWLFANGLKQYFLPGYDVNELGAASRIKFAPDIKDATGTINVSKGEAWLLKSEARFLKVSYVLEPLAVPDMSVERHLLFDQVEGTRFSYVHTFEEDVSFKHGVGLPQTWSAKVLKIQFFYTDAEANALGSVGNYFEFSTAAHN